MTKIVNAPETVQVQYFFYLHAEYARKLDRPEIQHEYISGGYIERRRLEETATGFVGGVVTLPEGTGRLDILKYAMRYALDKLNESRINSGMALLFEQGHQTVTSFMCDRNAL